METNNNIFGNSGIIGRKKFLLNLLAQCMLFLAILLGSVLTIQNTQKDRVLDGISASIYTNESSVEEQGLDTASVISTLESAQNQKLKTIILSLIAAITTLIGYMIALYGLTKRRITDIMGSTKNAAVFSLICLLLAPALSIFIFLIIGIIPSNAFAKEVNLNISSALET